MSLRARHGVRAGVAIPDVKGLRSPRPPSFTGRRGPRDDKHKTIPSDVLQRMSDYSAFRQRVWMACARIPRGETHSYGWIARKVGKPLAARAVGQALAANPFAPLIPCHRVVGADGKLTGYSGPGGLARKKQLLRSEMRPQKGWRKSLGPSARHF
jgi:O-6-methylguanine DNA methyltransferase